MVVKLVEKKKRKGVAPPAGLRQIDEPGITEIGWTAERSPWFLR